MIANTHQYFALLTAAILSLNSSVFAQTEAGSVDDPAFAKIVDMDLYDDALETRDAAKLTDVAEQVLEAESALIRKSYIPHFTSVTVAKAAAQAASMNKDKESLKRLSELAGKLGDEGKPLIAEIKMAELSGTRAAAPTLPVTASVEEFSAAREKYLAAVFSEAGNLIGTTRSVQRQPLGVDMGSFYDGFGVEITRVYPNTPAAKCGLRRGDYLHSINGSVPTAKRDFATLLRTSSPSTGRVTLGWIRKDSSQSSGAREFSREVQLKSAPPSSSSSGRKSLGVNTGDFHDGFGLEITRVFADSPAAKAGIRVGDYLHSVNGSIPSEKRDFLTLLKSSSPSSGRVKLGWIRQDSSQATGVREFERYVQL